MVGPGKPVIPVLHMYKLTAYVKKIAIQVSLKLLSEWLQSMKMLSIGLAGLEAVQSQPGILDQSVLYIFFYEVQQNCLS